MGTCSVTNWPENLSKKLIKELVQGRDSATQLQTLLHKPFGERGSVSAEELAGKVLTSFTEIISMVTSTISNKGHAQCVNSDHDGGALNGGDAISDHETTKPEPLDHHSHCDDRSSEDSGESSKKRPPAFKDRRGCYKRRKSSQSWTTILPTIEDGQAWRKYGQKEILNAQYPRAYFRCTRKYDQGCRATKQVQQIQDNPKMYQTTYIGQHTCKHILKAPQMIVDHSEPCTLESVHDYEVIIGFDHSRNENRYNTVLDNYTKSDAPALEEEQDHDQLGRVLIKDEAQISEDLSDKSSFDANELWSDFKDIELSDPSMGLLLPSNKKLAGDNDQDVSFLDRTSCASLISLDIVDDFVVESIGFCDSDFRFDEADFPL